MFDITRPDGRSQAQVLIDAVGGEEPGKMFSFDALVTLLEVPAQRVSSIVANANRRLLREHRRCLRNIRGKGYAIAAADEHMELAFARKRRADVMMTKGVELLKHVRLDELDEATRQMHIGNLLVFEGMLTAQKGYESRLQRIEAAVFAAK